MVLFPAVYEQHIRPITYFKQVERCGTFILCNYRDKPSIHLKPRAYVVMYGVLRFSINYLYKYWVQFEVYMYMYMYKCI